jgi:hypothetical protein
MLAGCTSAGLSHVYVLSLRYAPTSRQPTIDPAQINPNISRAFAETLKELRAQPLEMKVSYMGFCISNIDSFTLCSSNAAALAAVVRLSGTQSNAKNGSSIGDPVNVLWIAKTSVKDTLLVEPLYEISLSLCRYSFMIAWALTISFQVHNSGFSRNPTLDSD